MTNFELDDYEELMCLGATRLQIFGHDWLPGAFPSLKAFVDILRVVRTDSSS